MCVPLPRGPPRRDAARLLHHNAAREIRKICREAHAEQVNIMKPQTSKTWFLGECNSSEEVAKDEDLEEQDGLEEHLKMAINSSQAREYAETACKKAVDSARQQRAETANQKNTQEEIREQRKKELEEARASVVLGDSVESMVKKNMKDALEGDPVDPGGMNWARNDSRVKGRAPTRAPTTTMRVATWRRSSRN